MNEVNYKYDNSFKIYIKRLKFFLLLLWVTSASINNTRNVILIVISISIESKRYFLNGVRFCIFLNKDEFFIYVS